jgi:starch synthase
MTEQKGFDLVACVLDDLMCREDVQFMLLGTGDERFENFMRGAEQRYKGRLCSYIGYSEPLSHLVYAASDFFLMPSRFEPCGISQMLAMRYGSIPIVRETGGLRDTVLPYNQYTGEGNGFSFANYDAWEMRDAIRAALGCYQNKEVMDGLITNAMKADFGFERSAEEYARLYLCML